jgi:DNA polymerase III subunit epsilon
MTNNKNKNGSNLYFEPDYHRLNREAKKTALNGSPVPPGETLSRLFSRLKKTEPAEMDPEVQEQLAELLPEIKQSIDWVQDLDGASYVAFDTETTGLHPYRGDEITAIGAVIVEGNRILDQPQFYQLVNPGRPVSKQSREITGLTDEMLQDQPRIGKVLLDFLTFAGPRILLAHNAPFDLAFINNKLGESIGRRITNPVIDTVLLATALYYSLGDYTLENLADHFDLSLEGRHNALADARIAASLYLKLLPDLKAKGVTNLPQLAGLFAEINLTKGYPLIF